MEFDEGPDAEYDQGASDSYILDVLAVVLVLVTGISLQEALDNTISILFKDTVYLTVVLWVWSVVLVLVTAHVVRSKFAIQSERAAEQKRWLMASTVAVHRSNPHDALYGND